MVRTSYQSCYKAHIPCTRVHTQTEAIRVVVRTAHGVKLVFVQIPEIVFVVGWLERVAGLDAVAVPIAQLAADPHTNRRRAQRRRRATLQVLRAQVLRVRVHHVVEALPAQLLLVAVRGRDQRLVDVENDDRLVPVRLDLEFEARGAALLRVLVAQTAMRAIPERII